VIDHAMSEHEHRATPAYFRVTVIGLEFSSPIIAGLLGGYYLGEYFHQPWIGLAGLLGGVFLGFCRLILELRNFLKANQ
jgi:F0F1-type ATP synthase assembly protein I